MTLSHLSLVVALAACESRREAGAPGQQERAFLDAMVPHHQEAIAMGRAALDRAERPELATFASRMITKRERELELMTEWRSAWFGGALPDAPLPELERWTTGAPFDRAYLDAMIPHHQQAMRLAREARRTARAQEIRDIAATIIANQEMELDQLEHWRDAWYPPADPRAGR